MSRYYDDELYHYGRLGMKWGKHIFGEVKSAMADRKAKKTLKKAAKSEERAERKQQAREKRLDQLSKSPTYLWKNRAGYTTAELNKALERINTEQRIHDASVRELKRGKDICDTIIGYGVTLNNAYSTINTMSANYKSFKSGAFGKPQQQEQPQGKPTPEQPAQAPSPQPRPRPANSPYTRNRRYKGYAPPSSQYVRNRRSQRPKKNRWF